MLVRHARFESADAGPLSAGRLFQSTDAPLYDVRLTPAHIKAKLAGLT